MKSIKNDGFWPSRLNIGLLGAAFSAAGASHNQADDKDQDDRANQGRDDMKASDCRAPPPQNRGSKPWTDKPGDNIADDSSRHIPSDDQARKPA